MSKAGILRKSCLQGKARMLISHGKMSQCHGQKRKLKHVIPRRQTSLRRRMMRALKPPRSAPWRPGKARHAKQPSTPTSGRLTDTRSSSPLGRHNFHFSTNKFGFEQTQTFFWPALGSKGLLTHWNGFAVIRSWQLTHPNEKEMGNKKDIHVNEEMGMGVV